MEHENNVMSLGTLPNEVLCTIFSQLPRQDLFAIRFVNSHIASAAIPALFSTVSTSFDTLLSLLKLTDRPHIVPHIRTLIFYETSYSLKSNIVDHPWPYIPNQGTAHHLELFREYYGITDPNPTFSTLQAQHIPFPERHNRLGPAPPLTWKKEWGDEFLDQLVSDTMMEYKRRDEWQHSEGAFYRLYRAMEGLPSLRDIIIQDARRGGIVQSTNACQELKTLQEFVPLSEGSFFMLFRDENHDHAAGLNSLLMVLRVLSVLKRHIGVRALGGDGLMRTGISLIGMDDVRPIFVERALTRNGTAETLPLEIVPVEAFRYLRSLELTIRHDNETGGNRHRIDSILERSLLKAGLGIATQLESLRLCHDVRRHGMGALQGLFSGIDADAGAAGAASTATSTIAIYPRLKHLMFDKFHINPLPQDLPRLIRKRMPQLETLEFTDCVLDSQRWRDVVQNLSDDPDFTLLHFSLAGSTCDEEVLINKDDPPGPWVVDRQLRPGVMSDEALIRFVNNPGLESPFNRRRWRSQRYKRQGQDGKSEWHVDVVGGEDGFDEYESEDGSMWERRSDVSDRSEFVSGRDPMDEDTDGAEWDSDYDFSAEESSDDEMDIDVDEVRVAGAEVRMETSIHIHRNKMEKGVVQWRRVPNPEMVRRLTIDAREASGGGGDDLGGVQEDQSAEQDAMQDVQGDTSGLKQQPLLADGEENPDLAMEDQ